MLEGTEIAKPLSSTKNSIGKLNVAAMFSAAQNPFEQTLPSPPIATATAPIQSCSPKTSVRWRIV